MNAPAQKQCGTETDHQGMFSELDILWAAFRVGMRKHIEGEGGKLLPRETEGDYRKRAEKAGILALVQALKDVGAIR